MHSNILAIDIGSSKISAAIAEISDGEPKIIGFSSQKSQGIKKGYISNIEHVSRVIKNCINDAKRMAGIASVDKAIVSISGNCTDSLSSYGVVNVGNSDVTDKSIKRAFEAARVQAPIPADSNVIQMLPYSFKLDDQEVEDPEGMSGSRLEVSVLIIVAKKSYIENLKKVVFQAGATIEYVVLSAHASAISTLSDDEKKLGVACIDMGGETCDLAIYLDNYMRYSKTLGFASQNVTLDLANVIGTSTLSCEDVKLRYVDLDPENDAHGALEILQEDGKKPFEIDRRIVNDIVAERCGEIFGILQNRIKQSGLADRMYAIVLTGGMTKLKNFQKFAQKYFSHQVRIAKPYKIQSVSDAVHDESNAVIVGLIMYGVGNHANYEIDSNNSLRSRSKTEFYPESVDFSQDFVGAYDDQDLHDQDLARDRLLPHFGEQKAKISKTDIMKGALREKSGPKKGVMTWVRQLADKLF